MKKSHNPKKVYITWHYTTHGIAYLKHVLSEFYRHKTDELPSEIAWAGLDQKELHDLFSVPNKDAKGFAFDEIIYLTAPQEAFDGLSSRRFNYKHNYKDIPAFRPAEKMYDEIREKDDLCYNLAEEREYIQKNHPDKKELFEQNLWMDIQHYDVKTQIKWFLEDSNFSKVYEKDSFKEKEMPVSDLRDIKQITEELKRFVETLPKDDEYFINVSLGSSETQVAWHILADYNLLPEHTRFLTTYDDKNSNRDNKFKLFSIKEIPTRIFSNIGDEFSFFEGAKSAKRELVDIQLKRFLNMGFSILLIGERGIGKSSKIKDVKEQLNNEGTTKKILGKIIEVNCATFTDDNLAESRLFGYKKGAFTSADKDTDGLIKEAENGILFLDEVHALSPVIQEKLMKAFQTDENNTMSIRRIGDNKVEEKVKNVRLIFATNKSIDELRKVLLPDFYDRIVQYVIAIPPLRETREDIYEDWEKVWGYLKFENAPPAPKSSQLIAWLKGLPLYGNYRDLQKIAMYYHAFNEFNEEERKKICNNLGVACDALSYTKKQFELYHSPKDEAEGNIISVKLDWENPRAKDLQMEFNYQLYAWAKKMYGKEKTIAEKLGVEVRTLNNWKKRK